MIVREFLTKWGFQVQDQPLDRMERRLGAIQNRLNLMIAGKMAMGLYHMAEKFSKVGEQIEIAANAAGISVEEFQKLAYAGKQSNVEMGELQGGMSRLARSLYMARTGSEQFSKAFSDLGIGPEAVKGFKNTQEALFAIADKLKGIQDPIKRAALGQQLLGRGAANLVSMLSKGSVELKKLAKEAKDLGIVLTKTQVGSLDKLENSIQRLWAFVSGIFMKISADIAPVFNVLIDEILEFYKVNRQLIELNIQGFLESFAFALGFLWEAVKVLTQSLINVAKKLGIEKDLMKWAFWITAVGATVVSLTSFLGFLAPAFTAASIAAKGLWAALIPLLPYLGILVGLQEIYSYSQGKKGWISQGIDSLMGKGGGGGVPEGGGLSGLDAMRSGPASGAGAGGVNYSVNAPMTFNVPEGTDPKDVGKSVRQGAFDHIERILREADRSFTRVRAY